jgi:two-component system, OmpR family, phosphate regulon sensor histidine kinase PhoR
LLFRLRGPRPVSREIALVYTASEESIPRIQKQLEPYFPKLIVPYTQETLAEDTVADTDCRVRQAMLQGGNTPSPTLLAYHRLNATSGRPEPTFPVAFDYSGPSGSYRSFSEGDLSEAPRNAFHDKVVLIAQAKGIDHYVQTPFGPMSLLEVQANILDSLWNGRNLTKTPRWLENVSSLVVIALSVAIILRLPLRLAWLPLAFLAGVWALLGSLLLGHAHVLMGIENPIVSIVASYLLLLGYKIKKQEEAYWQTQREIDYTRKVDEFKNNFISLFSHDLKTPIARIKAIVTLAQSETPPPTQALRDSLRNIDRASDDLARLIGDILKITKMESMALELERDVVDLNRMVELAAQRLKHLAEEKKIQFTFDLEPLFPVEGDPQLIQEVVLNLVENAIKYGACDSTVRVTTHEETGRVRVTIEDFGKGISAEELPRVTGKFYRGKNTLDGPPGSGLGLYLAKYFVELHKGELEIRSEPGKGTTVSFWLPMPV